jgi:hypothetical protein
VLVALLTKMLVEKGARIVRVADRVDDLANPGDPSRSARAGGAAALGPRHLMQAPRDGGTEAQAVGAACHSFSVRIAAMTLAKRPESSVS